LPTHLNDPPTSGLIENAPSADAWFITSLNVTLIAVDIETPIPVGVLAVTVGAFRLAC
jgi:hypothetical protein